MNKNLAKSSFRLLIGIVFFLAAKLTAVYAASNKPLTIDTYQRYHLPLAQNQQNRISFDGKIEEIIGDTSFYNFQISENKDHIFLIPKIDTKNFDLTIIVDGLAQDLRFNVFKGVPKTYFFTNRTAIAKKITENNIREVQFLKFRKSKNYQIIHGVLKSKLPYTISTKEYLDELMPNIAEAMWCKKLLIDPDETTHFIIYKKLIRGEGDNKE